MNLPLNRIGFNDGGSGLISKEIHCMGGVMPEEMIGPASRLSQGIDIGTPKKIGLHIHLLNVVLTAGNSLADPLMTWVKTPGVAHHGDTALLLLQVRERLGIFPRIRHRDLDLNMLASPETLHRLVGMNLGRRAENDRIHIGAGK